MTQSAELVPTERASLAGAIASRLSPLALRRSGVAVLLHGPPGIGVSYLAGQVLRDLSCRNQTVRANAHLSELAAALPNPARLGAWARAPLERLLRGEHLGPDLAAETVFALLSGYAPAVLLVEDLHDARPERLAFWAALARAARASHGVGLLLTSHASVGPPFEAIALQALDLVGTRGLVETELGAEAPPEAVAWLHARAAGNPLFTLEHVRFLARQGFLWNDGQRWRFRAPPGAMVPASVEALLERSLRGPLDEPRLSAVIAARAFLPGGVDTDRWAAAAGLTSAELAVARAELERAGILAGNDFSHRLIRDTAIASLPAARRRSLARSAFAALGDAPRVAATLIAEAAPGNAAALDCLQAAANSAEAAGDYASAARYRAMATEYASGEARGRLALAAARGLRTSDPPEATRLAELAVWARPDDTDAVYLLAELLTARGRMDDVDRVLDRLPARERAGAGWPARLLRLRALAGDYVGAAELWHTDPALRSAADPEVQYQAAHALSSLGERGEAIAIVEAALRSTGLSPDLTCRFLNVIAGAHYYAGEYSQADERYRQARRVAEEHDLTVALPHLLFNHAYVTAILGRRRESLDLLEDARSRFAALGNLRRYAHAQVTIAGLLIEAAEYERAEQLLTESHDLLTPLDPTESLVDCQKALATLYLEWRPPNGGPLALKHAYAVLRTAQGLDSPRNVVSGLSLAARAEAWQGDGARAADLADKALSLARELAHPWAVAYAFAARAAALEALGQTAQAIAAYRQAADGLRQIDLGTEAAAVGLEADRLGADNSEITAKLAFFLEQELGNAARHARAYLTAGGKDAQGLQGATGALPRLDALGPMQITVRGASLPLRGRRRQELLALLLEARIAGRHEVPRLELIDRLYREVDEEQAGNALKATVHQARSALGNSTVLTTSSGYALGAVTSDAEEFLATGNTSLWRGPFLENVNLESREDTAREALYAAARTRAAALTGSNPGEAARVARVLLDADPYDTEALSLALRALRAGDNHRGLARLYERTKARLLEVGERLPERWADFLQPA